MDHCIIRKCLYFVDLTTFQTLGQNLSNFFVAILVQTMTPKGHFEINWSTVLRQLLQTGRYTLYLGIGLQTVWVKLSKAMPILYLLHFWWLTNFFSGPTCNTYWWIFFSANIHSSIPFQYPQLPTCPMSNINNFKCKTNQNVVWEILI